MLVDVTPLDEDTEPHEWEGQCFDKHPHRNCRCMLKPGHDYPHESYITRKRDCRVVAVWAGGCHHTEVRSLLTW